MHCEQILLLCFVYGAGPFADRETIVSPGAGRGKGVGVLAKAELGERSGGQPNSFGTRADLDEFPLAAYLLPPPIPSDLAEDALPGPELVTACIEGRQGAWESFVRRFAPLIFAVARRSLRSRGLSPAPDDLDDICENTFLAFVKDDFALLRTYDRRYALSTYVGVVARTQAGRFARRRRGFASEIDVAELPSRTAEDPALAVEEGDLVAALRATLEEMPERDRTILTLFYFSDRDYRAIATDLKISPNSVGAALHRARERLRARLELRESGTESL